MILYHVQWITRAGRKAGEWAGTQAEAARIKAARRSEGIKAHVQQVDVPTNKPGLLGWLNDCINEWT